MSDPKDETSTNTTYSQLNSTNWLGPIVVKTGGSHISAPKTGRGAALAREAIG
jgi:hypothetical protein